jgi:hypothetical protein
MAATIMKSYTITLADQPAQVGERELQTMVFLHNAVNDGWTVKRRRGAYIFQKKHRNRRDVESSKYLDTFINKHVVYRPSDI